MASLAGGASASKESRPKASRQSTRRASPTSATAAGKTRVAIGAARAPGAPDPRLPQTMASSSFSRGSTSSPIASRTKSCARRSFEPALRVGQPGLLHHDRRLDVPVRAAQQLVGVVVLEAGDDGDDPAGAVASASPIRSARRPSGCRRSCRCGPSTPVVSMLSTILVAVPALSRVDPAMTSGPTAGAIVRSTKVCSSVRGSQVTKMIFEPARRARVSAPRTNCVMPLADTPMTTSFLVGRSRLTERAPSS